MPTLEAIVQLGVDPIPGEAPGGEAARYEPDYEFLVTEVGKLELPDKQEPDWEKVIATGSKLLGEKSKDFLLAAYVTHGLFMKNGFAGIAAGLKLLHGLTQNFWDTGHPNRVRARNNALGWLGERSSPKVQDAKPGLPQLGDVTSAKETIDALVELWATKAEERPAVSELARYLGAHQSTLEAAKRKAEADAAARAVGAGVADGSPDQIADKAGAVSAIEAGLKLLSKAQAFLIAGEPKTALPYRLNRFIAWAFVEKAPENQGGLTMIPGIRPELPAECQEALLAGGFLDLIQASEARLPDAPLWLDQQRHVAMALEGLGEEYFGARDAVIGDLSGLLRRIPTLIDLRFDNEVPFADDATKTWIRNVVLPAGGGGEAAKDPRDAVYAEARKLAGKGRWQQAFALFQESLNATGQRRERFLWQLSQARLCMDAGKPDLALPQFQALDEEVRRLVLEDWEPAVALLVIKSYLQCLSKLGAVGGGAEGELIQGLKNRLARLDLVTALELNGNL